MYSCISGHSRKHKNTRKTQKAADAYNLRTLPLTSNSTCLVERWLAKNDVGRFSKGCLYSKIYPWKISESSTTVRMEVPDVVGTKARKPSLISLFARLTFDVIGYNQRRSKFHTHEVQKSSKKGCEWGLGFSPHTSKILNFLRREYGRRVWCG